MSAPLTLEYHGKATAQGHWRKGQELIDALAYIDPLTPDVKNQVDKLIEEEMRRSTLRPQDYLNKLPPMPPAKFEGHPMLQKEYERYAAAVPAVVHLPCRLARKFGVIYHASIFS